jgi:hypothetical protein
MLIAAIVVGVVATLFCTAAFILSGWIGEAEERYDEAARLPRPKQIQAARDGIGRGGCPPGGCRQSDCPLWPCSCNDPTEVADTLRSWLAARKIPVDPQEEAPDGCR